MQFKPALPDASATAGSRSGAMRGTTVKKIREAVAALRKSA
jgi:hypothetical protein